MFSLYIDVSSGSSLIPSTDPLSPTLTGAGGALQTPPFAKRGFRFRLPLSIVVGGGGGGGWHLASCAHVTTGAEWVRERCSGQQRERAAAALTGGWEKLLCKVGSSSSSSSPAVGQQACGTAEVKRSPRLPRLLLEAHSRVALAIREWASWSECWGKQPQWRPLQIKVCSYHVLAWRLTTSYQLSTKVREGQKCFHSPKKGIRYTRYLEKGI